MDHASQTVRHHAAGQYFKLPATHALELAGIEPGVPEIDVSLDARVAADHTYREIAYAEHAGVGYLQFEFYNGAMSTDQCLRLRDAYAHARAQQHTQVIVLLGGEDYFSNGIHLNVIEAAEDPAAESWSNLVAIDDLVRDIVQTDSHLVISALAGDAAAGGVPLALAADCVVAREDTILNPYYQHMGGLYGSEYWTYLLPRRVGDDHDNTAHWPAVPAGRNPGRSQDRAAGRRVRDRRRRLSSLHSASRRARRERRPARRTPGAEATPTRE